MPTCLEVNFLLSLEARERWIIELVTIDIYNWCIIYFEDPIEGVNIFEYTNTFSLLESIGPYSSLPVLILNDGVTQKKNLDKRVRVETRGM